MYEVEKSMKSSFASLHCLLTAGQKLFLQVCPPPQPLHQPKSSNMLYLIGLGLSDEADITVKGLEIVKKASRVYLEAYTSILLVDKSILVSRNAPEDIGRADADI
jgi:hypothetical protein